MFGSCGLFDIFLSVVTGLHEGGWQLEWRYTYGAVEMQGSI